MAGPRQCGKTTLAKKLVSPSVIYRTLDDATLREAALDDPRSFVEDKNRLMIIDEIQKAPVLLSAIKKVVDEADDKMGQFLLTGSANLQTLPGVVESLAGRVKKVRLRVLSEGEMNGGSSNFLQRVLKQSFGAGLALARQTVESYINALESLYLVDTVSPWRKTDYDRVGAQSKLLMTDSGLMGSILGWRSAEIQFDSDRLGKLIETFVYHELSVQMDLHSGEYSMYHYRDRDNREVDFIIERDDGHLVCIEVQSSASMSRSFFKHLKWFHETVAPKRSFIGIVLYAGDSVERFGKNMWAIPISALWSK